MKKTMKKLISGTLALACVVACMGTMTACETSKPEFTMTLSFNGETYEMDYYLNRKVAPATTNHFIWLAENGYYDGLCVHNYTSSRMYAGAFEAATDANDSDGLVERNYFDFVKNSPKLSAFPHSVWEDKEQTLPLYTLRGEFKNNSFEVKSGALNPGFGALTMYYVDNSSSDDVYVEYASQEGMATRQYQYNSATSLFYLSLDTSVAQSGYCTFALLQDGEDKELKELQEDIADYIEEQYGEETSEFTTSQSVTFGEGDMLLDNFEKSVTCSVPKAAIVIESIKITKY